MLTLIGADGVNPVRSFTSVEEMNETMISNWNRVVTPQDKIYHLGDVGMWEDDINKILPRLNGKKTLIAGNHDILDTKFYAKYFKNQRGVKVIDNMVLTHVPIHTASLEFRWHLNIHGHIHDRVIMDTRYKNVCVEAIGYTPISIDEIRREYNRCV